MPEVEKQMSEVAEAAECEVKPGGLKFAVVLEDAKVQHCSHISATKSAKIGLIKLN